MAKVSLRAYNQEIETMIDRGHLDEAIAHCRHILKTFPKHLESYRLLGKAYLEYKRYPEAADIFSRVLVAVPTDFVANVGMSIIRDEENKLDDAIWHMERAFETQPSNAAIQSELQRLYGRREGVQPPRIRMTRGALAHMYVQGELYPQAISEIKSVLSEDPGRNDMQVLLARAYYRSGLKNDAAEVASGVLRSNPYNLDANRVLVEILGTDHPEGVQAYRQRVVELDPYAAQVTGSIFLADEVPDAAVTLEHLDWNGQPVGLQPDWQSTQAIALEGASRQDEQPDWLKDAFGAETPAGLSEPAVSPFDMSTPSAAPAEPAADIPDFLREAGWGKATGAFDESKAALTGDEPASPDLPIEQGELPDWVKAMAPQQPAETPEDEEELPDWINKIGKSELPLSSDMSDQPDWMKGIADSPAQPSMDQPDWLEKPVQAEPAAASPVDEEPDWLKGFGAEPGAAASAAPGEDLDWLTGLTEGQGPEATTPEAASQEFDFLNRPAEPFDAAPSAPGAETRDRMDDMGVQPEPGSTAPTEDFDFLDPLSSQVRSTSPAAADEFDFLNELTAEGEQLAPADAPESTSADPLGMSAEEQDDSFAWLESLAAKQGTTEGLLTKPEERLEEEPDWVRQAKSQDTAQVPDEDSVIKQPTASVDEPGKSEEEPDDTLAWLEGLAAKQGASEGSLTQPEERREETPEWVRQADDLGDRSQADQEVTPAEMPAQAAPPASLEDLGTSEQDRDDSFAWLEALAAKQGASEGLLTKPEERPAEEPEWIKQAKDLSEAPGLTPAGEPATSKDDTGAWLKSLEEETTSDQDRPEQIPDWLQPEEEAAAGAVTPEPFPSGDETGVWLKSLDEETVAPDERPQETAPAGPIAETPASAVDTAAWLKSLDEEETVAPHERSEETAPIPPAAETPAWLEGLGEEEAAPAAETAPVEDEIETWLQNLEQPEKVSSEPVQPERPEELPAWMDTLGEQEPAEEISPAIETPVPADEVSEWMSTIETPELPASEAPKVDTGDLPSWLRGLEQEKAEQTAHGDQEDLPSWLRDETGEPGAEPTRIEPTRATDWHPVEAEARQPEPEPVAPELEPLESPAAEQAPPPEEEPVDVVAILEEKIAATEPEAPVPPARSPRELTARKVTGALTDPVLAQARSEFSRSNISGALENYSRLIKKGRLLEDIIYDLREALYRHPVDVDIWQSLGDAYMRSNRLQDALDAYTKAEELLR